MRPLIYLAFILAAVPGESAILIGGAGDSIMEGATQHQTDIAGTEGGNTAFDPMYRLAQNSGGIYSYTNFGYPSWRWDQVASGALTWISNSAPAKCIFHCGVNDIDQGYTWAQTDAQLTLIKTYLDGCGITMILDDIFPDSNFSDANAAIVRTWNANYRIWAATNGVTVIASHDSMGQNRVSTGYNDDLKTTYDQGDGVHLSAAGVDAWSLIMLNALTNSATASSFKSATIKSAIFR